MSFKRVREKRVQQKERELKASVYYRRKKFFRKPTSWPPEPSDESRVESTKTADIKDTG